MATNTTGFKFSNEPSSPNSDVNAENLNGAVENAIVRNIAEGAILPGHLHVNGAGAGIGGGNGNALYVKTDSNSIEIENDAIQVKESGINTEHLQDGSITMDKLADAVKKQMNNVLRGMYSVGDFFITRNATFNPASRFGGQWELVKDKFLIGAGGDFTLASTGGEKESLLKVTDLPHHRHATQSVSRSLADYNGGYLILSGDKMITADDSIPTGSYEGIYVMAHDRRVLNRVSSASFNVRTVGTESDPFTKSYTQTKVNTLPPYVAVYIWVKISDEDAQ